LNLAELLVRHDKPHWKIIPLVFDIPIMIPLINCAYLRGLANIDTFKGPTLTRTSPADAKTSPTVGMSTNLIGLGELNPILVGSSFPSGMTMYNFREYESI